MWVGKGRGDRSDADRSRAVRSGCGNGIVEEDGVGKDGTNGRWELAGQENVVLCGANSYEQKYYFNRDFDRLPEEVKKELQIMCVLFTEDVGGVLTLEFTSEGELEFKVQVDEGDYLFDEIGSGLKIRQYQREKRELLKGLEVFYQVFFLGLAGPGESEGRAQ